MFVEALQARLRVVDDKILRLTMLASKAPDDRRRLDDYWDLAQDLQREARELRSKIKNISECKTAESGAEQSSQSAASNSPLTLSQSHTLVLTSHQSSVRRTSSHQSSDAARPRWQLHHA
jgi:hypothetical protein